ncbi:trypsin-like protease [Centruroides vittatus]|uniref:trypsin-like protease n=1 Tax=Centruroides vittatus TaxID=120091 RepID=UPI00350F31DB
MELTVEWMRFGLLYFLPAVVYAFSFPQKNEIKSGKERRMIGGSIADDGEFPFMVAIFRTRKFCGGFTLITTQTVLGAAHVIDSNAVEHSSNVQPIALLRDNKVVSSGDAMLIGWGRIGTSQDDVSECLHSAEVRIVDPEDESLDAYDIRITGKEIITITPGVISMKGDSGSPLIIKDDSGRDIVIGLLSRGGNDVNEPDIYMSTCAYSTFIRRNTVGNLTYF